MRRGFLLDNPRPKMKKELSDGNLQTPDHEAIAVPESIQPRPFTDSEFIDSRQIVTTRIEVGFLEYGKVQDTSLPTDFKPYWTITFDAAHGIIKSDTKTLVLVTVPPKGSEAAVDGNDHTEWITIEATRPRVFNAPGFPKPIPKSRGQVPAYEVKLTPNMGLGVFATRDLKHGELVFAERPLLMTSSNTNALELVVPTHDPRYAGFYLHENEKILEAAVSRMSPANQATYKALANGHKEDGSGPLTGILRTNAYALDAIFDGSGTKAANASFRYSAVCNVASRINHSCMVNIFRVFDMAAFCFIFKASQDIKKGEQFFYSYCDTGASLAKRQRQLAPYGIVCECHGCITAAPERDRFREEYIKRTKEYEDLNTQVFEQRNDTWPNKEEFKAVLKFQAMAIEEGLHTQPAYQHVLHAVMLGYSRTERIRSRAEEALTMMQKNAALFAKPKC